MSLSIVLWGLFGSVFAFILLFLAYDAVRKMSGSGLIYLAGLATLFIGERWFGESDWHWFVSGPAILIVLASLGLRALAITKSSAGRRDAHRNALIWMGVSILGLFLYVASQGGETLGLSGESLERYSAVFTAAWPILVLVGCGPMFLLDRLIAVHPVMLPLGATQRAVRAGLSLTLAMSLVVPANYLGAAHKKEWDLAYFRTTRPSESTINIVRALPEGVTATLFYPPGNEVREQVVRYFETLIDQSGTTTLQLEVVDQPMAPKLSEALKVRENGYIVLHQGEEDGASQKFKVGTDMERARRDLRKLDASVQKHLLKLSRGQRKAYLMVGHGEASPREKDEPLRKINEFKKLLQDQNYKVENLGGAQGSASELPDDADVIIVAAPKTPLLPEEEQVLIEWFEKGGKLFVLLDPGSDPLEGLLGAMGVKAGSTPLANAQAYVSQRRGKADRVFLVTNRFGSHDSVKTLSRNSTEQALMMPTAVAVEKVESWGNGKITPIVRSLPNTWADTNGNFEREGDEEVKVWELGYAVEANPGGTDFRGLVLGDVSALADIPLQFSVGNRNFAKDSVRWLVGEEEFSGEENSEEDVKIKHTRDEEVVVFLAAVGFVPMSVLGLGAVFVRIRRRRKEKQGG